MIPKYYTIRIFKSGKLNLSDDEIDYLQREGFRENEIKNMLEKRVRENLWRYIDDNNINIIID